MKKLFLIFYCCAFGKTLENPAGNEYNLFTGKPQIGGLGYAFLFRNYRPNLGKWTSSDPLGYPDGWNNLAYVNNWVVSCIDRFGADIYHVNSPLSVGGLGHSGAIVGTPQTGYHIMNHGTAIGVGSSANNWATSYTTLEAALDSLNSGRTGDERFTRIQVWRTTLGQDDVAYNGMLDSASDPYDTTTNNCWHVIQDGLNDANVASSSTTIPNVAFLANNATTLDFIDVQNGTVE